MISSTSLIRAILLGEFRDLTLASVSFRIYIYVKFGEVLIVDGRYNCHPKNQLHLADTVLFVVIYLILG